MKTYLFLMIAFLAFTSCSEAQNSQAPETINKVVNAEEFNELLKGDVQLIDVRTEGEYAGGAIDGAVLINFMESDFEERLKELDPKKTTLVYCAAGGRSGKAAKIMKEIGFSEVYDLKGGYGNWPFK